jgi:hypothetical protein
MQTKIVKGTRVLVRTASAGVHYGTLESRSGQETHLMNARRIWSWNGALSLSEIAAKGLDVKNSKISEQVEEIILPTSIEVILISDKSNLPQ